MAGQVKARRRRLEARSWAAWGGQTQRDLAATQPWSAHTGWERELIGGACVSVRGEREGAEDGRRESNRKAYSGEYAKGVHGPSRPMRGMMACE
jgi:hypothetical protein